MLRIACLLSLGALLVGCGGRSERDVEAAIARLEAKRDTLKSQVAALDAVEASRKGQAPLVVATLAPGDVERALKGALPLSFDASRLHQYVGGKVEVLGVTGFKIEKDRDVRFDIVARGKGIKLRVAVPPGYQQMAKELISGLKAGVTISVRGQLYTDARGRTRFLGSATGAKLKKHAKKRYHGMIRQGVNQSLLARPHSIDVDPLRAGGTRLALKGFVPTRGRMAAIFAR